MLFSIVIPVFNTEKNLFEKCLKSIQNNHLDKSEFEVIFINDGMEDFNEYRELIDQHLHKNNIQIKIIDNNINMKQGYARYEGLIESKGDYIHFVDSDDQIYQDIYTTLVDYLDDDPNFVVFLEVGVRIGGQASRIKYNLSDTFNIDNNILKEHMFLKKDVKKLRSSHTSTLHNKIFNRKWLLNNVKMWIPNFYSEDTLINFEILSKAEKFRVLPRDFYKYNFSKDGVIECKGAKFIIDNIITIRQMLKLTENNKDLRNMGVDFIFSFYSYFKKDMDGNYDFLFIDLLKKYDFDFEFMDKKQYQFFKSDADSYKLFSPFLLPESEKFFDGIVKDINETILPPDKTGNKKLVERNFKLDKTSYDVETNLESLFLSSVLFTLTKFVYSKKIFITKLFKTNDVFEKIIFPININTNNNVESFQNNVVNLDMMLKKHSNYFFNVFKEYNDIKLPDFQFYYKNYVDDIDVGENNIFDVNIKDNLSVKYGNHNLNIFNSFTIICDDQNSMIKVIYDTSLYSDKLVDLFINSLLKIIDKFKEKTLLLKDISIGSDYSKSKSYSSSSKLLSKSFEEIFKINKDKIALIADNEKLTYEKLNSSVNRVANALLKKGLQIGDRVVINLRRDSNLIIGILGVINAGGTFILVNHNDPIEKINFIKEDSEAKYVLINKSNKGNENNVQHLNINDLFEEENKKNLNIDFEQDNDFCVNYTSGSTGKPKGVIQTHGSIFNKEFLDSFNFEKDDVYLLSMNPVFIPFIETLILFFYHGATIVLTNDEILNFKELIDVFDETNFNIMFMTPSILLNYLENDDLKQIFKKLKIIYLAGEKLQLNLVEKLRMVSDLKLYNWYGSSETLVSNLKLISNSDINNTDNISVNTDNISVGKPVANVLEIIVDIDGNPLPLGIVGELWVGGSKIAKRYVNNEKLTREKFTSINMIPFFKSGDLAVVNEDGAYSIIGRVDNQVKLRGQRIEIGDIENNIPQDLGLNKTFVVIQEKNNNQYLTLYFTIDEKLVQCEIEEIKKRLDDHLKKVLPKFMVPQIYIHLEEFPLTFAGKIDIKELSFHNFDLYEVILPSTDMEKKIFDICVKILGYRDFGVTNSLLSIGFTSLLITKLSVRIFKELGVEIFPAKLMDSNNTIRKISTKIQSSDFSPSKNILKHDKKEYYPLSFSQRFYAKTIQENPDVILSLQFIVKLNVYFDPYKLKKALIKTIDLNSFIKTCFEMIDGKVWQKRNDDYRVDVKVFNKKMDDQIKKDFISKRFNIFSPPLFCFEIYHYNDELYLLMNIHHIVSDGPSLGIFIGDLMSILHGQVPIKEFTCFDYICNNILYLKSLNSYNPDLSENFMTPYLDDDAEPKIKNLILDKQKIDEFCQKENILANTLILSGLSISLSKHLKENNFTASMIYDDRHISTKYSNVFGCMTNYLVFSLMIDYELEIKNYLKSVKEIEQDILINSVENSLENSKIENKKQYTDIIYNNIMNISTDDDSNNILSMEMIINNETEQYNQLLGKKTLFFNSTLIKIENNVKILLNCVYRNISYSDDEINNLFKNIEKIIYDIIENPSKKVIDII
ncbi:MAG: AMP-binding protein [Methanobrevibacter sp.]|nr:AMP-binding protein [Candidatus Methanovirga aequatorialis]